MSCHTGIS